eukprot:871315-Lingulodinium_polyedra.AAC.1
MAIATSWVCARFGEVRPGCAAGFRCSADCGLCQCELQAGQGEAISREGPPFAQRWGLVRWSPLAT